MFPKTEHNMSRGFLNILGGCQKWQTQITLNLLCLSVGFHKMKITSKVVWHIKYWSCDETDEVGIRYSVVRSVITSPAETMDQLTRSGPATVHCYTISYSFRNIQKTWGRRIVVNLFTLIQDIQRERTFSRLMLKHMTQSTHWIKVGKIPKPIVLNSVGKAGLMLSVKKSPNLEK